MKKLKSYLLIALTTTSICSLAQPKLQVNDFRIGGYDFMISYSGGTGPCFINSSPFITGTYGSSMLNVIAQDGFNCMDDYNESSLWTPVGGTEQYLTLISNIAAKYNPNFKIMCTAKDYYKPPFGLNSSNIGSTWMNGVNDYNDSDYYAWPFPSPAGSPSAYTCQGATSRADYQTLFSSTYANPSYSPYIWGYSINEEGCYDHQYVNTDKYYPGLSVYNPTTNMNTDPQANVPVPVARVSDATGQFRAWLRGAGITPQKMCTVQAMHGKSINNNSNASLINTPPIMNNNPNPQDYINPSLCTNMPDVFFESSYFIFPYTSWYTEPYSNIANGDAHYLGKFKSIDYALTKVGNVQAMNDVEGDEYSGFGYNYNSHLTYEFHSNNNIQNANYLWLLTYGSIIHGASGAWFWGITQGYTVYTNSSGVPTADVNGYPNDLANYNYMSGTTNNNRFAKTYFPYTYQNFVSPLSRELAYLVSNNLLSTDQSTVAGKKTDEPDPQCIVPPAINYLNSTTLGSYMPGQYISDHQSENYGLRYTIRTNGIRTVMIISNMLPVELDDISLNFANCSNPIIENANEAQILFESAWPSSTVVSSNTYKTNRATEDGYINLTTSPASFSTGAGSAYTTPVSLSGKSLTLSFGPLDTHVIEFVNSTNTLTYDNDYANGWTKQWSNNGSGVIGGVTVETTDQILVGDFLNDGTQQIMDIEKNGSSAAWATILKYVVGTNGAGSWQWMWSNYGSGWIGGVQIQAADQFIVGDFSGLGYDQLLSVQQAASGNWGVIQSFTSGTWNWLWSNYGSNTMGSWNIGAGDRYIVGDFTHSGSKQLLCIQNTGTNAKASLIKYSSGSWSTTWSNSSTPGSIDGWDINTNDRYEAGDLTGSGYIDRALVSNSGDGWAAIFYYTGTTMMESWSNGGSGSIGGVGIPQANDAILIGNLDNKTSNESDMFFIQGENSPSYNYAVTVDLASGIPTWHWSNHNSPYTAPENGYINDWPVADPTGSVANYYLFKPIVGGQPYLLALRSYGCNNIYLASTYSTSCTNCGFRPIDPNKTTDDGMADLKVYPNPNNGNYTVELTNNSDNTATIEVYDLLGQLVKSIPDYKLAQNADNLIQVNMDDVPSGQYILKCITNNTVRVAKVMVKK